MYNIYKARKKMIRDSKKRQEIWRVLFYSMWGLLGCVLINTSYYSIQFTQTYIYIYILLMGIFVPQYWFWSGLKSQPFNSNLLIV